MSSQTRAAFIAEYRAARAREDFEKALEIVLSAIAHDAAHPGEPRLMDELRGLHTPAAV